MRSIPVKKYPVIGDRTKIPQPDAISPLEGMQITMDTDVDLVNGMTMTNSRGKQIVVFQNTDESVDLVVTPNVTATVYTYAVESVPITIGPGEVWAIGPFSANFEESGEITFDFTGVSGICQAIRLP